MCSFLISELLNSHLSLGLPGAWLFHCVENQQVGEERLMHMYYNHIMQKFGMLKSTIGVAKMSI